MRLVAIGAVFHHRRMLPQERTAPFGVATQAVLVDRGLSQLAGVGRSVRIVTARARYLAFAVRHVRGALQLRSPHLVTLQTQFRLRLLQAPCVGQRRIEAGLVG